MKQPQIDIPLDKIEAFCRKWKIKEFALFGSVLREDFRPDSDVDVLVTFEADGGLTFDNREEMLEEIEMIFGRKIDLIERKLVERSENYIRRRHILQSLEPIYVAG
ncbi:MAG: nucleotidyltransferase domain-containing protein [Thermodesulfobacteriota bacterium]